MPTSDEEVDSSRVVDAVDIPAQYYTDHFVQAAKSIVEQSKQINIPNLPAMANAKEYLRPKDDENYRMTRESEAENVEVANANLDVIVKVPEAQPEDDSEAKEEAEVVENFPNKKNKSIHHVPLNLLKDIKGHSFKPVMLRRKI